MRSLIVIIALIWPLALPAIAQAASPSFPTLTDLQPIAIRSGVNPIPTMTHDGRDGIIVVGRKSYMTADGSYNLFLVMTPGLEGWNIVTSGTTDSIDPDDGTILSDVPHTGEDAVRSVRFARGLVDGHREFVLLIAQRDFEGTIASASHTTISVFVLQDAQDAFADRFVLRGKRKTTACYGNADVALLAEIGLALPLDFGGPTGADVCGAN